MNKTNPLLKIVKILKLYSDSDHILKERDIKEYLLKEGIEVNNRKTIYRYLNDLNSNGYRVIYDSVNKGYYLDEAPFSIGEIKILLDSINQHKDLDTKTLTNKLLSFISLSNRQLLLDNQLVIKNINNALLPKKPGYIASYSMKIEECLKSISKHLKMEIYHNNKARIIEPYYLYFSNNKYYLHDSNLYSYRIDRINYLKVLEEEYLFNQDIQNKIINKIKTSYDNFDKNESEIIIFKCQNYEEIKNRLKDDFPNHYLDNKHNVVVEYKPNEIFFSKIIAYNGQIVIDKPIEVKEAFLNYLNKIIKMFN